MLSEGNVKVGFRPNKENNNNSVTIYARALYEIQVPSSTGFLVLTQTKKSNGQVRGISLQMFLRLQSKVSHLSIDLNNILNFRILAQAIL